MIIDTHAHFTRQIMLKALASEIDRFQNIQLLEEDGKSGWFLWGRLQPAPCL